MEDGIKRRVLERKLNVTRKLLPCHTLGLATECDKEATSLSHSLAAYGLSGGNPQYVRYRGAAGVGKIAGKRKRHRIASGKQNAAASMPTADRQAHGIRSFA
jgi:hypothetical protein